MIEKEEKERALRIAHDNLWDALKYEKTEVEIRKSNSEQGEEADLVKGIEWLLDELNKLAKGLDIEI